MPVTKLALTPTLTARAWISTLAVVIKRLVEIAFVVICAFGIGYLVWGSRIDSLSNELAFLSDVVSHQTRQVQRLAAASSGARVISAEPIDCPPLPEPASLKPGPEVRQCFEDRERLSDDLENCLFDNARLNSQASAQPTRPRLAPRTGTALIEEIVEQPSNRRSPGR